ncbi:MAG: N-acetyltransferase [Rhodospirillaceae bacterium]|nr:N-acetyltransferase [Rhodospirillaceae bacterium]MBT6510344.1 N-acetyltransferase [Rhodospirillaceae bacterium]MBT7612846.1 N-acetyltransferase [Rhodospirillaceae bacterium]
MSAAMQVRDSTLDDVAAIAAIYGHHVVHGVASFEIEPPGEMEIGERRTAVLEVGLPHLVAEREGCVIGFAYAGPYRTRPAYHHTVENSVYVDPDHLGVGAGRALLGALMTRCREAGRREMIAIIGDSGNRASIALHEALGFRHVGTFENVGFKHGRWLDSVLMQRSLT